VNPYPNRQQPPDPGPGLPAMLYVLAAFALFCLPALPVWVAGAALVRLTRVRLWHLAAAALVLGAGVVLLEGGPTQALARHFAGYALVVRQLGAPSIQLPPLGSIFLPQLPLAVPTGLAAAACHGAANRDTAIVPAEFERAERRQRGRAKRRARRRAERLADREAGRLESDALGTSLGGDLASWQRRGLIVPPPGQLGLATILIGAPNTGKSVTIHRLGYLAARERRHLIVIDAKGGHDGLAQGVVAAYLAAWPDARVRLFPQEPLDIWRGTPQAVVNRLVEVWDWTPESAYYREVATVALRLAVQQPGGPCRSTEELVARLEYGALARVWKGRRAETVLVEGLKDKLADVQLRVANLVAALGPAFDGDWSYEDCDLAVITVPSMIATLDADACLRVLLSDVGHFTMSPDRKRPGAPSLLIVDEFSAIQGGRRKAIDLLERGRGAGTGVVLAGQSAVALGDEDERARLLAAASAQIVFRTPQPAELAALAGSERVAEAAWQAEEGDLTGRQTITMRARGRVDQDQVRGARTGEAHIISAGHVARARIIRTAVPSDATTRAVELVAGERPALPAHPAPPELPPDPAPPPKELPA
jgi:hypothetical protein